MAPATKRRKKHIKVETKSATLKTGDYALKGYEDAVLVERKGSLDEIAQNCLKVQPRKRFIAALDRLRTECSKPVLVMEGHPYKLSRPTRYTEDPELAVDGLQRLLLEYGVDLILLPTDTQAHRRAAGDWTARLLINGALTYGHQGD